MPTLTAPKAFTLSSPAHTDAWRKPPSTNAFNAPSHSLATLPLSQFLRARLTFTGSFPAKYDQAGLLLHLTKPGATPASARDKWFKAGVECFNGQPWMSTVGTDRFSDWAIAPLPQGSVDAATGEVKAAVEARREGDENGVALWVYGVVVDAAGEVVRRVPLRECAWFFAGEDEGWEVEVAGYVCRPGSGDGLGELVAGFEGCEVERKD